MEVVGAVVAMVSVVVAAAPLVGVTLAGENEQVAAAGREPQEKFTVPLYPAEDVTVKVNVADCPGEMVAEDGCALILKSGTAMMTATEFDVLGELFESPAYVAVTV